MQHGFALFADPYGLGGARERLHPAESQVPGNGASLAERAENCRVRRRSIVAEIRRRECRRMLEVHFPAKTVSRLEWIVGPIKRTSNREWRETLLPAQRGESRLVAHSVIDAEVNIAGVDARELERVVGARGRAVGNESRERPAKTVSAVNVNTGCAAAVRENSKSELVGVREKPRLPEIRAQIVCRREVSRAITADIIGEVTENEFSVQRAGEKISCNALKLETLCAAQEVVVRKAAFHLEEIHCIESGAHARLAEGRLLHSDDNDLARIALLRDLDCGTTKKVRL